ncbi:MAG: type II toxin-antitoxin system VapC family toxin [Lachnospiraceae bacterium]|nr:type II toxin-antitoxin system VapC family toxin [Lachnospiraceae bacterium]
MKIYLDNCCYNRPYDDQSQLRISLETQAKLYVQEMIKNGELELTTSYVLQYENSENPYEIRKRAISEFVRSYSNEHIDYDRAEEVGKMAKDIMKTGVKTKDAHHVACAILASCDYFLTTDKRLLKYATDEIKIMNPIDFIEELEER